MRVPQLDGPVDCATFDRFCHAYLDEELAQADREALEAHLDACPACARLLAAEASFDAALRQRYERAPLPAGLEDGIRAALAGQRSVVAGGAPRWRRFAVASVLAASVLVALATIPLLIGRVPPATAGGGDVVHVHCDATVVDLVCDSHGLSYALQRACRNPEHVNALRLADGTYWGILPTEAASRAGVEGADERGRRVAVVGDYYPAIHSVAVLSVEDLAARAVPEAPAPPGPTGLATLLGIRPKHDPAKRGGA